VTGVTVGLIYATNSESVLRLFGDNLTRVSRVSSILSTDVRSGASAWADIIQGFREYNTRYPVNRIISDPITRFVLSASVFGQITMYVDGHYFPRLNNEYIKDFETSDHSRDLLIINERGVAETGNSRLARHWPPELTNTRKHYPASLRYYLQSNEDQYTNVWKSSGIDFFSFPPFGR